MVIIVVVIIIIKAVKRNFNESIKIEPIIIKCVIIKSWQLTIIFSLNVIIITIIDVIIEIIELIIIKIKHLITWITIYLTIRW